MLGRSGQLNVHAGSGPVVAMVSGATIDDALRKYMRGVHEIANP
jgi:hypothetical protein